jgi:CRP-like cAMP-binding protein
MSDKPATVMIGPALNGNSAGASYMGAAPLNTAPRATSLVAGLMADPALGARRVHLVSGTIVYDADTPAGHIHLIQGGEVRLYQLSLDGSRRLLEILGPGQWFGVEAVGRMTRYDGQAQAVQETTLLVLPAPRFLSALSQHPQISLEIIGQLAGRLSDATAEASGLAFDDCRRRLIKTLLRFSRSAAATQNGEDVILRMTHEQLAQAIGAARETVSLTLTELRQANLLRTGRNRLAFNFQTLNASLNHD